MVCIINVIVPFFFEDVVTSQSVYTFFGISSINIRRKKETGSYL